MMSRKITVVNAGFYAYYFWHSFHRWGATPNKVKAIGKPHSHQLCACRISCWATYPLCCKSSLS